MNYKEKDLTDIFKNEPTIWNNEDLDWFDNQLVYKLQNNELPENEKNKLIEMMANDQAVMNRYLQLKKQTMPVKETYMERFLIAFKTHKMLPLFATGLALVFTLIMIVKPNNESSNFNQELVRGISQATIYPEQNSLLQKAPEFLIANNKNLQRIRLQLSRNEKIVWISEFQNSHKFFLPHQIQDKLKPGTYTWVILDHKDYPLTQNSFKLK